MDHQTNTSVVVFVLGSDSACGSGRRGVCFILLFFVNFHPDGHSILGSDKHGDDHSEQNKPPTTLPFFQALCVDILVVVVLSVKLRISTQAAWRRVHYCVCFGACFLKQGTGNSC